MGKINLKSIAFWGAEAPPYGGMTVHIKRLSQHLHKKKWQVLQYNFASRQRTEPYIKNITSLTKWYIGLWFTTSPKIHYVITTRSHIRFLASLLVLKGKIVIIRVGGQSLEHQIEKGGLSKVFNILSLKLCSAFIGVNENISDIAKRYMNNHKVHHIPGFIAPQTETKSEPNEIDEHYKKKGLKILITGQLFDEDSLDIYGLFHFIDTLKLLNEHEFEFKAVIAIYGSGAQNFDTNLIRLTTYAKELENKLLIHINEAELWPEIKKCDLFVRPSVTDGDANAIREALYFNKVVIASDCVNRPGSCILYKSLDSTALATAIQKINNHKPSLAIEIGNQVIIEDLLLKLNKSKHFK